MHIGKKVFTRSEIEQRIGNIAQIGGTRHYELVEGNTRGVGAIDFYTGSGFRFTLLPSRGMDISAASYKGINLVYLTPNGEVHSAHYDPQGLEWLRTFFGGLLTTCGLTYFGPPGKDGNEELGLHGRIANIPARRICDLSGWEGDEYILKVTGIVEECRLFGDKIRLTRTVRSRIGEKKLIIHDVAENFGFKESPFVILYHINPGFPLLDDGSELVLSSRECEPKGEYSREEMQNMQKFSGPIAGFKEQNFLHTMLADKDGFGYAAMINRGLAGGLGLSLKFPIANLPFLSEWKMMGQGDYVVGIEPVNTKLHNRAVLRKEKALPVLPAGEKREMQIEISVLDGQDEIDSFLTVAGSITERKK